MDEIGKLIEEEVQRRVNDTLEPLLQYIAKTYDISLNQILRDATVIKTVQITTCLGVSKKTKKRCKNKSQENGFCYIHQHQAPRRPPSPKPPPMKHTHTLPPFYLKGCPVCEKSNHLRDLVDCFENE